jgi:hypothetical protein
MDGILPVCKHLAIGVKPSQLGSPLVNLFGQAAARRVPGAGQAGDPYRPFRQYCHEHPTRTPGRLGATLAWMVNILGLVDTFGERPPGSLIALYGSTGNLIVSVVNGSAAQILSARVGDPVRIMLNEKITGAHG